MLAKNEPLAVKGTPLPRRAGKAICLMGPPGAGKSRMGCLTARQPVHVLDIDRKIASMDILNDAIISGNLSYWELGETLAEEGLAQRVRKAGKGEKPAFQPTGWLKFAEMVDRLNHDEEALRAETWFIDSYSRLGDHLKRLILYYDEHGIASLSPKNWGTYLAMQEETMTALIDTAKSHGKDLICSVHERTGELPGPNTKIKHTKDARGNVQREYIGDMTMKIAPTVEGSFAFKMFSYFEEVYSLSVEQGPDGQPKWVCHVRPDGLRDLRTSLDLSKEEYPCDFRAITSR